MSNNSNQTTKVSQQQLQAKKYIEEYELEKIISEMLNSVVHEKAKQPVVYMIKYLAGLITEEERKQYGLVIPEPYPKGKPIVKYPNFASDSLLKKHLTKSLWSSIKFNKTKYGGNIMNVIKLGETSSDDKNGLVITDGNCITAFNSLFFPLLADIHQYETDNKLEKFERYKPLNEFVFDNIPPVKDENFPFEDRVCRNINNIRVVISRNLHDVPFTSIMSSDKRQFVENTIVKAITSLQEEKILKNGRYLNYKENEDEISNTLKEIEFNELFLKNAELNSLWPDNRGLFISDDKEIIILVNFTDHFEIIFRKKRNSNDFNFSNLLNNSFSVIKSFEKYLNFEFDKYYGYLTTDPTLLGAGVSIYTEVELDFLLKKSEYKNLINQMKFDKIKIEDSIIKTKSNYKLSYKSYLDFFDIYYQMLSGLINLETDKEKSENFIVSKLALKDTDDSSVKRAYESVYDEYQYNLAPSGSNLNSLLRFYNEEGTTPFGILLTESSEYKTFQNFIKEYIILSQDFDVRNFDHFHKSEDYSNAKLIEVKNWGEKIISINVCLIRNLKGYPFPTSNHNNNENVEKLILKTLESLAMKNFIGNYLPINNEQILKLIEDKSINIFHKEELKKLGMQSTFPNNRGVVVFEKENIFAIVNDIDHIKFEISLKGDYSNSCLNDNFMQILKLSNEFSKHLQFLNDNRFGFLTACPRYIGTGLIIKSVLKLNHLFKNEEKIKEILKNKYFCFVFMDSEGTIELSNKITIGKSETEILSNLVNSINELIENDVE